ncbi:MAG: ABC transporter permease, partial [Giesbergeria sp.]|nr:ABC transporter permease [Giesbergeria sp.]
MQLRLSVPSLHQRLWQALRRWVLAWGRIVYLGAVVLVLTLSPSSYSRSARHRLARHLYLDTAPILPG